MVSDVPRPDKATGGAVQGSSAKLKQDGFGHSDERRTTLEPSVERQPRRCSSKVARQRILAPVTQKPVTRTPSWDPVHAGHFPGPVSAMEMRIVQMWVGG